MKKKLFTALLDSSGRPKMEADLVRLREDQAEKQRLASLLRRRKRLPEADAYDAAVAKLARKIATIETQLGE